MKLDKKRQLAAKTLKVGKNRIIFARENLAEIKEAITRQDIKDLHNAGAIRIKDEKGRKKIVKRRHRRGIGKTKKKPKQRKQEYVKLTRKLRTFARYLLKTGKIDKTAYYNIRKMIRAGRFRSKRHLNESLETIGGVK